MVFHSMFNGLPRESYGIVSNIPLLPIKTQIPGTAPRGNPNEKDIIDEALELFKANVLYKNFEIKGDADRLLVYLTFYISQCITKIVNKPQAEAFKILDSLSKENFALPGSPSFPLGGICPAPRDNSETEVLRGYLSNVRAELGIRFTKLAYAPGNDRLPSKWWTCFSKRKFLNKSL